MARASPRTTGGRGSGSCPEAYHACHGETGVDHTHAGTVLPSSVVRALSLWRMCSDEAGWHHNDPIVP